MAEIDQDAVLQLCEITGADPDIAASYLRVADGDVETAVQLYLENNGAPLDNDAGSQNRAGSTSNARGRASQDEEDEDDDVIPVSSSSRSSRHQPPPDPVRAPMRRMRDTLVGDGFSTSFDSEHAGSYGPSSYMSGYAAAAAGSSFGRDTGAAIHEAFRDLEAESRGSSSRNRGGGDRLADIFKAPTDIMFPGDFEMARMRAREMKKWMLVNPQEATEFACQMLNRDLWKDQGVKDFVKENFVFLQFGAQSPEGRKYASFYPFTSYPHIAIIDPRTGERVKQWNTCPTPADFIQEAMEFLEFNSLDDNAKAPSRKRKIKNVSEMSEEEQILAAMEASLAASGGSSKAGSSNKTPVVNLDDDEEAVVVDEDEDVMEVPVETNPFKSIKPVSRPEAPATNDATRVQIRLADGSRVVRRFLKTDPVRYIFEFIKSEVDEAKERPFELNFQKESLINHLDKTIADAGLANAAINVAWDD